MCIIPRKIPISRIKHFALKFFLFGHQDSFSLKEKEDEEREDEDDDVVKIGHLETMAKNKTERNKARKEKRDRERRGKKRRRNFIAKKEEIK